MAGTWKFDRVMPMYLVLGLVDDSAMAFENLAEEV